MWPSSRKGRLGVIVFACIGVIMLYQVLGRDYTLFTSPPPLSYYSLNITYWFLGAVGLPSVTATIAFYIVFLASVPAMLWLQRFPVAVWIFSLLFGGYIITFNILAGHHYHAFVGAFALTIPFWFKGERSFDLAWAGVRYYACFFLASAALWKFFRGSLFHHGHIANHMRSDYADILATHPDAWTSRILYFIVENPALGDILFAVVALLQLVFILGFFTTRFDGWLLPALVVLVFGNFIFFHVASWHVLILGCCFLPRRWLVRSREEGTIKNE